MVQLSTPFDVQRHGMNKIFSIGDENAWEKWNVVGPLGMATDCEYVCVPYECPSHPLWWSLNHVNKGTCIRISIILYSSVTLKVAQGPVYKVAMDGGSAWVQLHGLPFTKADLAIRTVQSPPSSSRGQCKTPNVYHFLGVGGGPS